jgi:hypothetical protein
VNLDPAEHDFITVQEFFPCFGFFHNGFIPSTRPTVLLRYIFLRLVLAAGPHAGTDSRLEPGVPGNPSPEGLAPSTRLWIPEISNALLLNRAFSGHEMMLIQAIGGWNSRFPDPRCLFLLNCGQKEPPKEESEAEMASVDFISDLLSRLLPYRGEAPIALHRHADLPVR